MIILLTLGHREQDLFHYNWESYSLTVGWINNPTDIEAGFVNVQNVLPSVTKHLRLLLY